MSGPVTMAAAKLDEYIRGLTAGGLMTAEAVQAFIDGLPMDERPQDGKRLAEQLVRHNRLTAFQAQAVYHGKGDGLVLGNYVLLDKIGQGGMGMVFKAQHRLMGRVVALKVLPTRLTKTPEGLRRFHREVRAAAALNHPNIVTAFDADEVRTIRFLVMEYVEGTDLSALVKSTGPLPVRRAVGYLLQVARALEYAHSEGIIHRDIKPSNLLLDRKGNVKVLDLGLARIAEEQGAAGTDSSLLDLTKTGMVLGTVDYMPPEQALGTKSVDGRSDIYSLGISLYYLLTGRVPYEGSTMLARFLAQREQEIPSLQTAVSGASDQLDGVFRKMVAKAADDRYATMTEVVAALEACLAVSPAESETSSAFQPDSAWLEVLQAISGASPAAVAAPAALPVLFESPPLVQVSEPASVTESQAYAETRQSTRSRIAELLAKSPAPPWVTVSGGVLVALVIVVMWLRGTSPQVASNPPSSPQQLLPQPKPTPESSAKPGQESTGEPPTLPPAIDSHQRSQPNPANPPSAESGKQVPAELTEKSDARVTSGASQEIASQPKPAFGVPEPTPSEKGPKSPPAPEKKPPMTDNPPTKPPFEAAAKPETAVGGGAKPNQPPSVSAKKPTADVIAVLPPELSRELLANIREVSLELKWDQKTVPPPIAQAVQRVMEDALNLPALGLKVDSNAPAKMRANLTASRENEFVVFRLSAELQCPESDGKTVTVWSQEQEVGKFTQRAFHSAATMVRGKVTEFMQRFQRDYRRAGTAKRG